MFQLKHRNTKISAETKMFVEISILAIQLKKQSGFLAETNCIKISAKISFYGVSVVIISFNSAEHLVKFGSVSAI